MLQKIADLPFAKVCTYVYVYLKFASSSDTTRTDVP